jgi:hypothetical protein
LSHSHKYDPGADKVGIISAVICAVHCLVIPAIFLLRYSLVDSGATAGWGSGLPHWWETLDYLFLAVGFYAVYHAVRHTVSRGIKRSLWFFWLCLAVAVIFEDKLHWMAYIASGGLVITHFINIRKHNNFRRKTS